MSSVIAVWGSPGAPGRTTVAAHLAQALALDGPTLLVDADTDAPSVGPFFGIDPAVSGLAEACQLTEGDALTAADLGRLVVGIEPGFDVLCSGSPAAGGAGTHRVGSVLTVARQRYRWVLVDTAAAALPSADIAPAAGRAAVLRDVDDVIALVAADVVGLQRFALMFPGLRDHPGRVHVVATKVRAGGRGIATRAEVRGAVGEFTGREPDAELPWAALALERAWLRAQHPAAPVMDRAYAAALDDVVALVRGPDAPPLRRAERNRGRRLWTRRAAS